MDEVALFEPGDRLAEFEIKEVLAEGGFAVLYVADEKASHSGLVLREVVLKVVKSRHAGNAEVVRRAEGELVTLCRLDHPNLCRVYRGGVLPSGAVYIAMERLQGLSLRDYVHRQGPLGVTEAFAIGAAVADALGALHEFGVVHRDVKPDNVFITTQNQVKLLDINSGRFYSLGFKSTVPGRSPGTPAFMAPEQFDPDAKPDHRSDLYALGLTLYEALTGKHAFAVTNGGQMPLALIDIIVAQVSWQFPSLADLGVCSPAEWEVLAKSLAKKAEDRYPRAADFARALRLARKQRLEEHPDASAGRVISQPGKRLEYVAAHEPVRGFQPEADPDSRVVVPEQPPRPPIAVPTQPAARAESQVERDLAVIRELGQSDDRAARDALLSVVQRRRHVALTVAALEELTKIGDRTCVATLAQVLESDTDPIVRAQIELTLAALDPEQSRSAAKPRPAAGRPPNATSTAPIAFATTEPRPLGTTTARGTLRMATAGAARQPSPAGGMAAKPPGAGAHGTLPHIVTLPAARGSGSGAPPLLKLIGLGALIGVPVALLATFAVLRLRSPTAPLAPPTTAGGGAPAVTAPAATVASGATTPAASVVAPPAASSSGTSRAGASASPPPANRALE